MPKNKLKRFAENLTFENLVQPRISFPPADHPLKGNWNRDFFKNENPIILELGCGRGEYTVEMAELYPEKNFIGIDWKGARLWRGAKTGVEKGMPNAAFLRIQIQNINAFFAEGEVDEIWITFPDPQPGKTGERKRLVSPRFLDMYRKLMNSCGIINLKTDSRTLYEYTREVAQEQKLGILQESADVHSEISDTLLSIRTTYEKMWLKEGLKICYIRFRINPDE